MIFNRDKNRCFDTIQKVLSGVLFLLFLFSLGCSKEKVKVSPEKMLLVYMIGDNNLSGYCQINMDGIKQGVENCSNFKCNLLVYIDSYSGNPALYKIEKGRKGKAKEVLIKEYGEQNSADKDVMNGIVCDVLNKYGAKQNGLVLWSHGTAWLPSNYATMTRSFGLDGRTVLEIDELAKALPDNAFDCIIFDACYMGSVECLFQLKNKADFIISSPNEIMDKGFPYHQLIPLWAQSNADFFEIPKAYYDYYDAMSGLYHSASVSLVNTKKLDALVSLISEITKTYGYDKILKLSTEGIQYMEYTVRNNPLLYDLGDYIGRIATSEQKQQFDRLMENVVLRKYNTPTVFYGLIQNHLPLEVFSGLSIYIPQEKYPKLNDWYSRLLWFKAVY